MSLFFQTCIWDYFGHRKQSLMNDLDKSLDDVNIQMNQDVSYNHVSSSATYTYICVCVCWGEGG